MSLSNRGYSFISSFLVFLHRLHEHYAMFVERLNCRYVFVDCLEKEGIITEEERRNIMEADGDVATRTYEDIPESCWPQMRDSEQMLMSNKTLLRCLPEKNYSQDIEVPGTDGRQLYDSHLELFHQRWRYCDIIAKLSIDVVIFQFVSDHIILLSVRPWPFCPFLFIDLTCTWITRRKCRFPIWV